MKKSAIRIASPTPHMFAVAGLCLLCSAEPALADDYLHVIRGGDTLIGLGRELLQKPGDWARVQRLNSITDPHRLRPGTTLRIPYAMLRRLPLEGRVTAVTGKVSAGDTPVAVGDAVRAGTRLTTGEQSFVTVTLVDGSRLVLQPSSRLGIEEMARYARATAATTRLRLESGRVESAVTGGEAPRPRYTIITPTATIGVRGTRFRVGTDADHDVVRAEVTEGTVAVGAASGKGAPTAVPAGFGLVAETGGRLSSPVGLLPAPELGGLPAAQERAVVRVTVPPLAGASGYRFQIGTDAGMGNVIAETLAAKPEARFADLPDGQYVLRVRGIDARGLEGRDADLAFRLKARPEPPFAVSPVGGSKLRGESAELSWSSSAEAARYRVQLAADAGFASPVADIDQVTGATVMPAKKLAPGEYFWRARSIRADGDAGPWGDAQRFVLRPPPAEPEPPALGDSDLAFAWSGEPGQSFLFQFARDRGFRDIVAERQLDRPAVTLPRPAGGTYYMRVRATDPDGFVGPYTSTQVIEIPEPPARPWWLLLLLLPAVL